MQLTAAQISGIDKALRQYFLETGDLFSTFVQEDILDVLYNSSIGAAATAAEIDSVAHGRRSFAQGTHAGLNFVYGAGMVNLGFSWNFVPGGTVTLSPSSTNYIEVDRAGTVTANTTSFTAGRLPLYLAVTGVSAIAGVENWKSVATLLGPNAINGTILSTAGHTKEVAFTIPTIATAAGDTRAHLFVPNTLAAGSKLTNVRIGFKDLLAADNTNYAKFSVTNIGQGGSGTQLLVDNATAGNRSTVAGGPILAKSPRDLTLVPISGGSERDVAGGDYLELVATVVGTLANTLTEGVGLAEFSFVN